MSTPPKAGIKLDIQSPIKQLSLTSDGNHYSPNLEVARDSVIRSIDSVPSFPLEDMLSAVLPKVHPAEVTKAWADLEKPGVGLAKDRRWTTESPTRMDGKENEVFESTVEKIISAVCDSELLSQASTPNKCLVSEFSERKNTSRPDSVLRLKTSSWPEPPRQTARSSRRPAEHQGKDSQNAGAPVRWCDVAVPFEWKISNSPRDSLDNHRKILWSMYHIMRNDPCRRFVFGMTIEGSKTILWFCNRSLIAASEVFDFMETPESLLKLLLAIRKCSFAELGYDPTIKRVYDPDENATAYSILVKSDNNQEMRFLTKEVLAWDAPNYLLSRGSRVWRVIKDGVPGRDYVLKDTWIDSTRPREGENLSQLLGEIPDDQKKFFLSPCIHGDVRVDEELDSTVKLHLRGKELDASGSIDVAPSNDTISVGSPASSVVSAGALPIIINAKPYTRTKTFDRQHYRFVSNEYGFPLQRLSTRTELVVALVQISQAVKVAHQAGWLLRDISPANVIMVGTQAKVIDYEYFKKADSDEAHFARTGTPHTMSTEVAEGLWKHRPSLKDPAEGDVDDDAENINYLDFVLAGPPSKANSANRNKGPPFRSNILHDIESLWWILLWILIRLVSEKDKKYIYDHPEQLTLLLALNNNLFPPPNFPDNQRASLFADGESLEQRLLQCFGDDHPLHGLADAVLDSYTTLSTLYRNAEAKISDDRQTFVNMDFECARADKRWLKSLRWVFASVKSLDDKVEFFTSEYDRIRIRLVEEKKAGRTK